MIDFTADLGLPQVMALVVATLACLTDLQSRRIPNALTFGGAALAVIYFAFSKGTGGLLTSLEGWLVGVALFAPFFVLGGLGAGDVKLVACIGAWLGPRGALWVALYGALAGGVAAIVMALATGYMRRAVDNLYILLMHFRVSGLRPHSDLTLKHSKGPRLPYALPIAAGTIAALWLH